MTLGDEVILVDGVTLDVNETDTVTLAVRETERVLEEDVVSVLELDGDDPILRDAEGDIDVDEVTDGDGRNRLETTSADGGNCKSAVLPVPSCVHKGKQPTVSASMTTWQGTSHWYQKYFY